jgi:hypothetical protein
VRDGDRLHDRQAEAEAAVRADGAGVPARPGPRRRAALERQQQPVQVAGRHDGTGVGHGEHRPAGLGTDGNPYRPVRHVVAQRVVDEVGHGSFGEGEVAGQQRGREDDVHAQPARRDLGAARGEHVPGDGGEVERFAMVGAPLTPGQREQRLDQPFLFRSGR